MAKSILLTLTLAALACAHHCAVLIEPQAKVLPIKVFNYQGSLPPIKDDRTGEVVRDESVDSNELNNTKEAEKACWDLIVDQTAVTFALHKRALDELEKDLKEVPMSNGLRETIEGLSKKMRSDMEDALNALKDESPEEYFDALFDTSENIVQLSRLLRDPKLDERVFLPLVKAVSRLGRNNSMLIQDFMDQCSLVNKSPRPRTFLATSTRLATRDGQ